MLSERPVTSALVQNVPRAPVAQRTAWRTAHARHGTHARPCACAGARAAETCLCCVPPAGDRSRVRPCARKLRPQMATIPGLRCAGGMRDSLRCLATPSGLRLTVGLFSFGLSCASLERLTEGWTDHVDPCGSPMHMTHVVASAGRLFAGLPPRYHS